MWQLANSFVYIRNSNIVRPLHPTFKAKCCFQLSVLWLFVFRTNLHISLVSRRQKSIRCPNCIYINIFCIVFGSCLLPNKILNVSLARYLSLSAVSLPHSENASFQAVFHLHHYDHHRISYYCASHVSSFVDYLFLARRVTLCVCVLFALSQLVKRMSNHGAFTII